MKSNTILLTGIAFGFVLVILLGSILFRQPYQYQGSVIDPPFVAPDFILTDQNGVDFHLSSQRGKLVLVFFGYTHCPDICPATLTEYQNIYQGLKERANEVVFIFITVDPERDTPQRLKDYVEYFNPGFVALTSDRSELDQVWKDYGVYQQRQETGSEAGYLVDHSTRMYLIDAVGNLVITYPFGFEANKITQDIRNMLDQGGLP